MRHYVIAYPEINDSDYALIQDHRKTHDYLYGMIAPHFTFVFGTEIPTNDFVEEIKTQSKGIGSFNFSICCAVINKDAFEERYYSFLVPDEGFSNMTKLHDKLYSGKLFEFLRLDIPYIPHLEIAVSTDKMLCKKLVDQWNQNNVVISGRITKLEIITFEKCVLDKIAEIPLV